MAIHHHFPGDQAHIQAQRFAEQRLHRGRMQGTKHQRGGGAMAYQLVNKKLRYLLGVLRIGKLALHREGVGGEPLQQLFAKGADHLGLRIVDVGIDKPGSSSLPAGRHSPSADAERLRPPAMAAAR
jgi:hypothetical protein